MSSLSFLESLSNTILESHNINLQFLDLFNKWCEINFYIKPVFLSRNERLETYSKDFLIRSDCWYELYLPNDINIREFSNVIRKIDCYKHTIDWNINANKLVELWVLLEKAWIYIKKYSKHIWDSNSEFLDFAKLLYQYWLSLQSWNYVESDISDDIVLSELDEEMLDEWFIWKKAYNKRIARILWNQTKQQVLDYRIKLIKTFFKTMQSNWYIGWSEKPWEYKIWPRKHLQDKFKENIIQIIKSPEIELFSSILRISSESLIYELSENGWKYSLNVIFDRFWINTQIKLRKLFDKLNLDKLKYELEQLRKIGDLIELSEKELKIAKLIRKEISKFNYLSDSYSINHLLDNHDINCVSASLLWSWFLN